MLKTVSTICFLLFISFCYSQTQHDNRLLERYSSKELSIMQKNNPEEYEILVRALDVGIVIGEIEKGEGKEIQFDGIIDGDPNGNHTFISLGLELKDNRNQYYKFRGTNKFVIVRSKNTIMQIQ